MNETPLAPTQDDDQTQTARDTERLDWLQANAFQRVDDDSCRQSVHIGLLGKTFEAGSTLREAIDAEMQRIQEEGTSVPRGNDEQPAPPITPESSSVPPAFKAEDAETIQDLIERTARELVSQVGADSWSETQGILRKFAEALVKPDAPSDRVEHVLQNASAFDFTPWVPPFHYDADGTNILDSQNRLLLDVRGWGLLTGHGSEGLAMDRDAAVVIQDTIAEHVTKLLNLSSVGRGPVDHLADQVKLRQLAQTVRVAYQVIHHNFDQKELPKLWAMLDEAAPFALQILSSPSTAAGESKD